MRDKPYLSVVVTTRNDDHGGGLLLRTHTFVNNLIGQVKRHALPCELIIVEWNPPPDRPRLRDALRWPVELGCCQVRIIEVPASVHASYRHSETMPLYQMIAKNAGILRAQGEFILATNIDILFSDELMAFLAARTMTCGAMYRIDRHDVMTDVPVDASVDEQLGYCATHVLRVNAREGTFPLSPEGDRTLWPGDIAAEDDGIRLGKGWFAPEHDGERSFRWVENGACVTVRVPAVPAPALVFEVAPGPGMDDAFDLVFRDQEGSVLSQVRVNSLSRVTLNLPAGSGSRVICLSTPQGGFPAPDDLRVLNFRVFRIEWQKEPVPIPPAVEYEYASESTPVSVAAKVPGVIRKVGGIIHRAAENGPVITVWVPVPRVVRRILRLVLGLPAQAALPPGEPEPEPCPVEPLKVEPVISAGVPPPACPQITRGADFTLLHTNACGDFTLMARRHWFDLRGYPEWDLYSFHIDSVFCYTAHYGGAREVLLEDPMRIYHIEHGLGSGWTPEGEKQLFERLRAKGIGWLDYEELVSLVRHMRHLACPLVFNRETWGLAGHDLPETSL